MVFYFALYLIQAGGPTDLTSIEGLSNHIFRKTFPSIATDTALLRLYKIKKVPMEGDDGAVWDSYDGYLGLEHVFTIENNWESKTKTDRITFISTDIKTKDGIYAGAPFKKIRHLVDTKKLNHGPDGYLLFFDAKNPCMSYHFDLPENHKLVNGIRSLEEVPDGLKIDAIIMQGCK